MKYWEMFTLDYKEGNRPSTHSTRPSGYNPRQILTINQQCVISIQVIGQVPFNATNQPSAKIIKIIYPSSIQLIYTADATALLCGETSIYLYYSLSLSTTTISSPNTTPIYSTNTQSIQHLVISCRRWSTEQYHRMSRIINQQFMVNSSTE